MIKSVLILFKVLNGNYFKRTYQYNVRVELKPSPFISSNISYELRLCKVCHLNGHYSEMK